MLNLILFPPCHECCYLISLRYISFSLSNLSHSLYNPWWEGTENVRILWQVPYFDWMCVCVDTYDPTRTFVIKIIIIIILELRSTERAEPTFSQRLLLYSKNECIRRQWRTCKKEKMWYGRNDEQKIVLRTSFRTTLLRKLRCTNEKQSRKILIKRNGVRRNNTYENDNPSTKVITGKTAKALNELVRTTSILWHKIWHHGQPEPNRQNKLLLKSISLY